MIANKIFTGILLSASVLVFTAFNGKEGNGKQETVEATAELNADQETKDVTSDGTGTFSGTFNKTTGEFTFELEWSGLTGPPSMMHFHGPADPGVDAGVKIPIEGFPTEADGSVSGTVTVEEADRADLLAGKWYVNIHTEKYGPGEIRGQVEFQGEDSGN